MLSELPAPGLMGFLFGYLLVLLAPGPNMIAIGCLAATEGLRGALPMLFGIQFGAVSLAAAVMTASDVLGADTGSPTLRLLAGLLLLGLACSIARKRTGPDTTATAAPRRAEGEGLQRFLAGYCTAASNPLTATFFAASLVALRQSGGAAPVSVLIVLGGIAVMAGACWLLLAWVMARPALRRRVLAREAAIRMVASCFITVMAVPTLWTAARALPVVDVLSSSAEICLCKTRRSPALGPGHFGRPGLRGFARRSRESHRSSVRRCLRASAAPLSRYLARARIRANPASLMKHRG